MFEEDFDEPDWGPPDEPTQEAKGGAGIRYPKKVDKGDDKKPKKVVKAKPKKSGGLLTQGQIEDDTAEGLSIIDEQISTVQEAIQKNQSLLDQGRSADTAAAKGELERLDSQLNQLTATRDQIARQRFQPAGSVRMREGAPMVTVPAFDFTGSDDIFVRLPASGIDPPVRQSTPSRSAAPAAPPKTTLIDPSTGDPDVTYTRPQDRQRVAAARVAAKINMINERNEVLDRTLTETQDLLSRTESELEPKSTRLSGMSVDSPSRIVPGRSLQDLERAAATLKARIAQLQEEQDHHGNLKTQLENIQTTTLGGYQPSKRDVERFGASLRAEGLEFDPVKSAQAKQDYPTRDERNRAAMAEGADSDPTTSINR
jgi:hypothetical protein